jgi:hypothetical protein
MPFCTVCKSPYAAQIDEALLGGVPIRVLSRRHGLCHSSLTRHRDNHIGKPLRAALRAKRDLERGEALLPTFEGLLADAQRIRRKAEAAKEYGVALDGIKTLCKVLELATVAQRTTKAEEMNVTVTFGPKGAETTVSHGDVIDDGTVAEAAAPKRPGEERRPESPPS